MRSSLLISAASVLLALAGPAKADTIFSENFDALVGGNYGVGQHVGQFTVMNNDVDVFGQPSTPYACGAYGNNCLDLNGNANGTIASDPLLLNVGQVYTVAFKMAGNGAPSYPSATYPYTFDVSLGGETRSFSIAPIAAFQSVSFDVTAASPLPTALVFKSTYSGIPTYWGAVLDDISITTIDATSPVPEPATWAMLVFGFGLVGAGLRRRPADRNAMLA